MILGIINIIPRLAMLMQNGLWDDIEAFLHLLLDPLFAAMQNEGLRITILSTVIWSFLVICGLVFVVYEFPSIIQLVSGPSTTPLKRQLKESKRARLLATRSSASRHQVSRDKAQVEREKREQEVRETGVKVAARIEREQELFRLTVTINNGSPSHIDMVVVDVDLPTGIDTHVSSFRMQRLGSISAGETKSIEFLLKPMGGNPLEIGGYVEFIGATYEVSKISLPVPDMEEEIINE